MFKKSTLIIPVLALGACAYAIDGAVQNVKFVTPGAHDANCNVYVEGLKYRVKPPQTLNIYKSDQDLVVDCLAPGNRRKVVHIEPRIEPSSAWNVGNAGVGIPWDYASGALFMYPDVVEVNFTDTPVVPQPPPAQNNPDIRQPEDYPLEEFSPGVPRMNADSNDPPVEILRRGETSAENVGPYGDGSEAFSEPYMGDEGKGSLMQVDSFDSSAPESSDTGAVAGPMPLIPGQ